MLEWRYYRNEDSEEPTVVEKLEESFRKGDLSAWAQELGATLIAEGSFLRSRRPSLSSEANDNLKAIQAYIESKNGVFLENPSLFQEFVRGIVVGIDEQTP